MSFTEGENFYAATEKDLNAVYQALQDHPALETRETELAFVLAALMLGISMVAMFLAGRDARPMQQARWLKSVECAVASPRRGECEASVPPPALCSGA